MSKLGTCKHCFQIQELYRVAAHPHEKDQRIDMPESYTCEWLEKFKPLPPVIQRRHGGFSLNAGDCDACQQYEPASSWTGKKPTG